MALAHAGWCCVYTITVSFERILMVQLYFTGLKRGAFSLLPAPMIPVSYYTFTKNLDRPCMHMDPDYLIACMD